MLARPQKAMPRIPSINPAIAKPAADRGSRVLRMPTAPKMTASNDGSPRGRPTSPQMKLATAVRVGRRAAAAG